MVAFNDPTSAPPGTAIASEMLAVVESETAIDAEQFRLADGHRLLSLCGAEIHALPGHEGLRVLRLKSLNDDQMDFVMTAGTALKLGYWIMENADD